MDLDELKTRLSQEDIPAYYRSKAALGIDLGPSFRSLEMLWSGKGEALGEVVLPASVDHGSLVAHPLLLDGCFPDHGSGAKFFRC